MLVAPKYASKVSESAIRAFGELTPPWGPVGYATYKRTYSRVRDDLGRTEEWLDTTIRGATGVLAIGGVFTQEEIDQFAYNWYMLKGCPAGRPIWQLGTDTVARLGGDSMQNCWHVAVDGPIDPFTFTFNELMLGGGVGFNITPEYVYALPPVRHRPTVERVDDYDCDFIVTDNREGWVGLLHRVLESFFFTGKNLRYDTRCIRAKGRRIKSFGGIASGPEKLVWGLDKIATILTRAHGRKLRPTECLDIMNIIGDIVVAGNVRRSAEIAIGSYMDEEFLSAKDWSAKPIPPWRQQSNNTVDCDDVLLLPEHFWKGYQPLQGEPYGLYNSSLCKSHGRLTDGPGYRPDPYLVGPNPCGEIILESHEACNLAETFLPNIVDLHEFANVTGLLFKAAKAIGSLPFVHPRTNEVVTRNNRIGIGITGFCQAPHLRDADIFNAVYDNLEQVDKEVSRQMNRRPSIKMTTVKPSGTLSLLAGVSPGVHPAYSPHFIRRITFAAANPLIDALRSRGFHSAPKINIDNSLDHSAMIVDFPYKSGRGAIVANQLSAIQQLENQRFLQEFWSDNSVSMTCYFREHELPEIRSWLRENYPHSVKTASFLRHEDHGFKQAPYEEITEAQYHELSSRTNPIVSLTAREEKEFTRYMALGGEDIDATECVGGACPAK